MTGHGGDVVSVARSLGVDPASILDLSASLNPLAPDVTAIAARHLDRLRRYPDDADIADATNRLAAAMGVEPDHLVLTNGAAEAIALVARLEPLGWVEEPDFSLYRRHLASVAPGQPRWRSNPNNPLGTLAAPDDVAAVWDESFWPLATGTWTRGDAEAYRIGSLTKLWACPGVRLGYVVAPTDEAAGQLAACQPAWAVGGLALALVAPLLDRTDLMAWATGIATRRAELAAIFRGHTVTESAANWVLVAGVAHLRLPLARHGVLVRDCASFGLHGTIRVAVPDDAGLERVARSWAAVAES